MIGRAKAQQAYSRINYIWVLKAADVPYLPHCNYCTFVI